MSSPQNYRSVMITGASSGLGEEFARQLAPCCDQMTLIARREGRLLDLVNDLKEVNPHLDVLPCAVDLTDRDARTTFVKLVNEHSIFPDLLINNAGMGDFGEFSKADWPKLEQMLELNVNALTHLTHALLPAMCESGAGDIINVSSLASIIPIPDFAVYAASKAYVTSLSEALRMELKDHDINVMALCPGPVHTEFGKTAMRGEDKNKIPGSELFYVRKSQVVSEALAGLISSKARVYPGWKIGLVALGLSVIPIFGLRLILGTRPRRER
ncbi:MAG: SDR family NAD(P)-dependent oxidoreductase [Rubritalea sp.]|uniref:SDR family NAD(P)-dependent oxidoreductase n=1 Tax=Rubritalea sp. TaxID=2109375 RepID=UPI0032426C67